MKIFIGKEMNFHNVVGLMQRDEELNRTKTLNLSWVGENYPADGLH